MNGVVFLPCFNVLFLLFCLSLWKILSIICNSPNKSGLLWIISFIWRFKASEKLFVLTFCSHTFHKSMLFFASSFNHVSFKYFLNNWYFSLVANLLSSHGEQIAFIVMSDMYSFGNKHKFRILLTNVLNIMFLLYSSLNPMSLIFFMIL